jgi:hypothetical protein
MPRNEPPQGGVLGHDQDPGDQLRPPTEPPRRQARSQTSFLVVASDRLLDSGDVGLDLEHRDRSPLGLSGKDVDRSSLTVDRVGRFGNRDPAPLPDAPGHLLDDCCVTLIEQTIEVAGPPAHEPVEGGPEGDEHSPRDRQAQRCDAAALDRRDRRLVAPGPRGEISLAPSSASPQRPAESPDSRIIHGPNRGLRGFAPDQRGPRYHPAMYLNALEFLEEERDAWRPFEAMAELSDEQLEASVAGAHGWAGRDLIGHLVACQENALAVARELAVGERSATQERLERDWNARGGDVINGEIEAEWHALPMSEVRERFRTVPGDMRGYLTVVPETRWVKNPQNLRYLLGETIEHYAEHEADLEAILAAAR